MSSSLGPWDHSKRLEQLGGVEFVAIVDPLVEKARDVLEKMFGLYAHLYTNCKVLADYQELFSMGDNKPDAAFVGKTRLLIVMKTIYVFYTWSLEYHLYFTNAFTLI